MLKFIQRYRSELLAVAFVAQLLFSPLADASVHLGAAFALVILFLLLAGASYSEYQWRDRTLLISFTAVWVGVRLCEAFDGERQIFAHLAPIAGFLLSCTVLWVILDRFGSMPNITASVISEAFISYLVIAIAFSQLYAILNRFLKDPFNPTIPASKSSTLMYFSMITLSSVGHGDIVPVNPYIHLVAALESMVGIFYIAVIVARLVSSFQPRSKTSKV